MTIATLRRGARAAAVAAGLLLAGCGDVLAVAGLTHLDGYWVGSYDAHTDFYLELEDGLYGLYGVAGFEQVGGRGRSELYVDVVRDGGRVRVYDDEGVGDLIFEGEVSGRDRLHGVVYLEFPPERVVLRRQ